MLASAKAVDFEEDLSSVEASVDDLIIAEEDEGVGGKGITLDFGPTSMTRGMIKALEKEGCILVGNGFLPKGETIPKPGEADAVVLRIFSLAAFTSHLFVFPGMFWRHLMFSSIMLL